MTVSELIDKLKILPPEIEVWGAAGHIEEDGPQSDVYVDSYGHAYIY